MKRAYALAFLALLAGMRAQAAQVVLMTSVEAPDFVLNELEARFHEKFDSSEFQVKVIRDATQEQLRKELLANDVAGLFWVSHAAREKSLVPGMHADATILDQYGDNVKDLFSEISPSLRYLAIIGCQAKGIAQEFAEKGYYGLHPRLRILAFDQEIEIHEGLDEALDTSDEYLKSSIAISAPPAIREFPILIRRTGAAPLASIRIDMGDAVLGFLPASTVGETQEMVGNFPEDHLQTRGNSGIPDLNIQVSLDHSAGDERAGLDERSLGTLEITPAHVSNDSKIPNVGDWKLFSMPDGAPVGYETELYLFTGTTTTFSSLFNP